MSQEFNFKYDQIRENERSIQHGEPSALTNTYNASYREEGHVRNTCFVCADGRRIFLNYSYLISGEFIAEDNSVILNFSSHIITMKGVNLESLFYDLMQHLVKQVACTNPRYNIIGDDETYIVNDIQIIKNAP